jgi:pyruvate dehydrogenase (quinone)/pyruvate oxidase
MMLTAAGLLVDRLIAWGVDVAFGLPGDGISGIMEAFRERKGTIRFVQVRHEEAAAFAACGYAKVTGRLGVCVATSGPGGIHLANGLYDAKLDKASVLAITGMPFHDIVATYTQQDVPMDRLFQDVAAYSERVMGPAHVENVVDLACRTALVYRTVAHITFPADLQIKAATAKTRSKRNIPRHTSDVLAEGAGLPRPADLALAAGLLNASRKVVILAGAGALHATDELEAVADTLGAPIVKALNGKAAVPDDSPFTTGGVGLLGTKPSHDALEECDGLLMVGTSFPYIEYLPRGDTVNAVQIELDPMRVGLRHDVDAALVGDSKLSLAALLPLLDPKEDRGFLEKAQRGMKGWNEFTTELGTRRDMPMKPQVVAHELGLRLADDAIVIADTGTVTVHYARHIPARRGQIHAVSGTLASMGNGLPYAIGAQIAYPGRQVVAFVGDGGLTQLMGELATVVKYELPIKIVVLTNNTLAMVRWEQMVFLGNPEFACDLQPIDFAAVARACGIEGFRVEDPSRCGQVIEDALRHPGPVLVDAIVDPNEPPLPPKITADEALKFARALARGEPEREKIAARALGAMLRELV